MAGRYRAIRQAAEALGIRQSTLSRRLCDIERRLGVVLFQPTNGGTHLTAMGLSLLPVPSGSSMRWIRSSGA
ncbi:MAG: helix-turn-helix domain-containing protein [Acetobacteraceae bacterium]